MNKKLLTLGTLLTITAPVGAVVACSPGSTMGSEEAKAIAALRSNSVKNKLTSAWLTKVEKSLTNLDEDVELRAARIEMTKAKIAHDLRTNSSALIALSNTWANSIKSDVTNADALRTDLAIKFAMNKDYKSFKDWEAELNSVTFDDFMDTYLLDADKILESTGFINQIDKLLIAKEYLKISKDDWYKVFGNEEDNSDLYKKSIVDQNRQVISLVDETKNFPLTIAGMESFYAYKWSISIKEYDLAKTFIEKPNIKAKEMIDQFIGDPDTLSGDKFSKYSDKNKKIEQAVLSPFKTNEVTGASSAQSLDTLYGFEGIVKMPSGNGLLNSRIGDIGAWEEKIDLNKFVGFVDNKKLLSGDEEVPYLSSDLSKEIIQNLYKGIIPTYNATSKKISFDMTYFDENKLLNLFVLNNSHILDDSENYYINEQGKNITIEIKDDYVKEILLEDGLKFIK